VAKLALITYLSAWLVNPEKGRIFSFLILVGALVGLIMLEPDMGTAIVLFGTSLIIYFLSDSELRALLLVLPLSLVGAIGLAIHSPYRLRRVLTFLNPEADPLGSSYHVRQALIAFGSGGLFGIGFGNSRQKYSYLPEANTDSIFAIIGEELGFIGSVIVVGAIAFFLYRLFRTTLHVEDKFGRLLGLGIVSWLALQTVINIGSMLALMPLTGVPLPFISYGGSALVAELIGIGILLNIWKINQKRH
jgi:cell division protein FtsW